MDEAEVNAWMAESIRLDEELRPFVELVKKKQDRFGRWTQEPTRAERLVDDLGYFYHGILLNEGAVFQFLDFMIPRRWMFEAIGARGCLAAMEGLTPFYEERLKLPSEEERSNHQQKRLTDLELYESVLEDPNVFGQLLLEFAQREL